MNTRTKMITDSVKNLNEIDGETLENIIDLLGMREQMTRQLVLSADAEQIQLLIDEKIENS